MKLFKMFHLTHRGYLEVTVLVNQGVVDICSRCLVEMARQS